jgi:TonB family protein
MKGDVEILSNTQGVDFGPYLQRALYRIKTNWYKLIPEAAKRPMMKKGRLIIQFSILKGGNVAGMLLQLPSGDVSLDRAAWGGITGSDPFEPLPKEFRGEFLSLRIKFLYNQKITTDQTSTPTDPFSVPFGFHLEDLGPASSGGQVDQGKPVEPSPIEQNEDIKVISDTRGVDFNDYIHRLVLAVSRRWYEIIPNQARQPISQSGAVIIRFAVLPDGTTARMRLSRPSGSADLDQAAWRSILESGPFTPLPKRFGGPDLVVSLRFLYNPKVEEGKQNDAGHVLVYSSSGLPAGTAASRP